MKSAYELAMERLSKADPEAAKPLSSEQKARLAEIDRVYKGKWAEREIFLQERLNAAMAEGKMDEIEKIKRQLSNEKLRIEEDRDSEKEQVRRRRS
jgi:hypothetical protein